MQRWELTLYTTRVFLDQKVEEVWDKRYEDGTTDWSKINKMASEGWDLVNVTTINAGGWTRRLLYTFKRPIEE